MRKDKRLLGASDKVAWVSRPSIFRGNLPRNMNFGRDAQSHFVTGTAQVGHWLKYLTPAFDGSTPLQLVERGEMDRIWRMLYDLESGQPG